MSDADHLTVVSSLGDGPDYQRCTTCGAETPVDDDLVHRSGCPEVADD
jgi:hypothetical protein